jgi:hypothetical protein
MSAASTTHARTSEIAIFGRLLSNGTNRMSRELARYILTLGFSAEDQARMSDLAARNQENALSTEEREELMNFVKVGHLLALLHSRARQALKKS